MLSPDTAIAMLNLLHSVFKGTKPDSAASQNDSVKIQAQSVLIDIITLQIKSADRIIEWAESCIFEIGHAIELYVDDSKPDKGELKKVATNLSALTDHGRLLLPNKETDTAFGGLADRCIDGIKLSFCVLTTPEKIRDNSFSHQLKIDPKYQEARKLESPKDYEWLLVGIRRAFVDEVSNVTNPRALNEAIENAVSLAGNSTSH